MTVHLTPAQEEQLQTLATERGRTPDELAQEAVDRFLAYQAHHQAAVEEARSAVARGEVLEHEDVILRIQQRMRA